MGEAKGREKVLARLEKYIPEIKEEILVLKAVEDIADAQGLKVATYTRGILVGGSALANPLLGVLAFIGTHPSVAIPLLRRYGELKRGLKGTIDTIINKINSGTKLTKAETDTAISAFTDDLPKAKGAATPSKLPNRTLIDSENVLGKIEEIKVGKSFGHTWNLDGSDYVGKDAITTLKSQTLSFDEATSEAIDALQKEAIETFGSNKNVKIGVFKMDSGGVSVDFNIATQNRELAERIAKLNNQESFWDAELEDVVSTGGTGEQVFTKKQIQDVLDLLDDPNWKNKLTSEKLGSE